MIVDGDGGGQVLSNAPSALFISCPLFRGHLGQGLVLSIVVTIKSGINTGGEEMYLPRDPVVICFPV